MCYRITGGRRAWQARITGDGATGVGHEVVRPTANRTSAMPTVRSLGESREFPFGVDDTCGESDLLDGDLGVGPVK